MHYISFTEKCSIRNICRLKCKLSVEICVKPLSIGSCNCEQCNKLYRNNNMHAHACIYIFCCALHTVCCFTIVLSAFSSIIQWIIFLWNCLIASWWCWRCCVLHSCHCITIDARRTQAHKKYAFKHTLIHTPTSDGNNSNTNNCTHFNFSKRCGFVQCSRLSMDPIYCIYTLSVNHTAKYVIHTLTALHTDTFISFFFFFFGFVSIVLITIFHTLICAIQNAMR